MEFGFLLKKGISFFLMPLPITVIFMLITLWFIYKQNIKKATIFMSISIVWLLLISYAPATNNLIRPLVHQYPKLTKIPKDVQYILLLGGDREHRTWEALRLYQQDKSLKIITSGYVFAGARDANITAKLLKNSGVEADHIVSQKDVKDTEDEASSLKKRIKNHPFILITSAYHMPRAMKLFQDKGLKPIAAPCNDDYIYDKGSLTGEQIRKTERALHEYIGLLWLKLKS